MKKPIFIILAIILVVAVLLAVLLVLRGDENTWLCANGEWVKHGNPAAEKPTQPCAETNQNQNTNDNVGIANPASVKCEQDSGQLNIIEDAGGFIGNQLGICNFPDGSKCEEWAYFRNECQIGNKIVTYSPNKNEEVTFPLTITGEARGYWFFEASFPVKIVDAQGNFMAQGIATAQSDWMTENFVPFITTLSGTVSQRTEATLILQKDNPSGLPQNDESVSIPIVLLPSESTTINVYFGNSQLDPDVMDCSKVFTSQRTITKTEAIGRAALEELLKGPTQPEKDQGYFTSINDNVKIQSLTIENGTAKVDFDPQLEYAVGGSCRVAAIRSQITQALKQFPTVNEVIVSIDGRTEDILQP